MKQINLNFQQRGIIKFLDINNREMSNGFRCCENRPLTPEEISHLKTEIEEIKADKRIFVFNDADHVIHTCYNPHNDIIYVGRNVFQNDNTFSTHPRDLLTSKAVLAHEYYGHRPERNRYLKEDSGKIEKMPRWLDEVYASLNAAVNTPNLTQLERATLISEAGRRAEEAGQTFVLTKEFKEILYGQWENTGDRGIVPISETLIFISTSSGKRDEDEQNRDSCMPKM